MKIYEKKYYLENGNSVEYECTDQKNRGACSIRFNY